MRTDAKKNTDILVADDSLNDLRLIVEILSREGFNVRPAIDGEAALASIRAEAPDLILLDIGMPKLNGFQVCRRLKKEAPSLDVPIIFLSASGTLDDVVKAFSMGAVDYITKPYQAEEVLARVATHLSLDTMKKEIEAKNLLMAQEAEERKEITEQLIRAKQAAEAANEAKSQFLANMSHELRTPLNHIIGFSEILVDKHFGELNDTQEEYLNDILNSGHHLLSLISDILNIAKVESGKMDLTLSEIDLEVFLRDSLNIIQEQAVQQGIKVTAEIGDIPQTIRADERKLKQVLYNLLANAVKFSPEGGEIQLRAEPDQDVDEKSKAGFIRISISDNGVGIVPDDLERIFGAFERANPAINTKYRGTGLGLYLSRQIVELHGGHLWAESNGEGVGSTFVFIIPSSIVKGPAAE